MKYILPTDLHNYAKYSEIISLLEIPIKSITNSGDTYPTDNNFYNILSANTNLSNIEEQAIDQVVTLIGSYYDTDVIFTSGSTYRNRYLIKIICDIIIYELNCRLSPNGIPEVKKERYHIAIELLKDMSKKNTNINLPLKKPVTYYDSNTNSFQESGTTMTQYSDSFITNIPW